MTVAHDIDRWRRECRRCRRSETDILLTSPPLPCGHFPEDADVPPTWWTPTVAAIVSAIVAEQAWDRCPVLADALEDGGFYPAHEFLALLRTDNPDHFGFRNRNVAELHRRYHVPPAATGYRWCGWQYSPWKRHLTRPTDQTRTLCGQRAIHTGEAVEQPAGGPLVSSEAYRACQRCRELYFDRHPDAGG